MFKKTLFGLMLLFVGLIALFLQLAVYHAHAVRRDPSVLLYKYHRLKRTHPERANQFLEQFLALTAAPNTTSRDAPAGSNLGIDAKPRRQAVVSRLVEMALKAQFLPINLMHSIGLHASSRYCHKKYVPQPVQHRRLRAVLPVADNTPKTQRFSELWITPFTQSRFGLSVLPAVIRVGLEQANRYQTHEYVFDKVTKDNRSKNRGQLTELYEDNVQIMGLGMQLKPVRTIPLVVFLETGAAYDLVYQQRNRWRPDLRTGLMYYQETNVATDAVNTMPWRRRYVASWYVNFTYFTRYTNAIAEIRTNQGLRLWQYRNHALNAYLTGRLLQDTQRLFFNNYLEWGPGITLTPDARYHLRVRAEHVRGVYLPAGRAFNPYGRYYNNNVIQFVLYWKI